MSPCAAGMGAVPSAGPVRRSPVPRYDVCCRPAGPVRRPGGFVRCSCRGNAISLSGACALVAAGAGDRPPYRALRRPRSLLGGPTARPPLTADTSASVSMWRRTARSVRVAPLPRGFSGCPAALGLGPVITILHAKGRAVGCSSCARCVGRWGVFVLPWVRIRRLRHPLVEMCWRTHAVQQARTTMLLRQIVRVPPTLGALWEVAAKHFAGCCHAEHHLTLRLLLGHADQSCRCRVGPAL